MVHIVELLHFLEDPRKKMDRLKRKMSDLESREADVKTELNYLELRQTKKRKNSVQNWLSRIVEIRPRVLELEHKVQQGGIYNRIPLTIEIDRAAMEVDELNKQALFKELVFEASDALSPELLTAELVGKSFQVMKSRIVQQLSDNVVAFVGIFGMGGIGKTTLLENVYNELRNCPNTCVFLVTVSDEFSVPKLQSDIARVLNLDLGTEREEKIRAGIIAEGLKRRQDVVVLVLDDLWSDFCLESVGVRVGGKCKVIFATRSSEVCDRMLCQLTVELLPLDEDEAWSLFMKTLGSGTVLGPQVEEIAKALAKECAGLPLGIVTMAASMRGVEDKCEWKNALESMRSRYLTRKDCDRNKNLELQKVFQALRHSYNALENETMKDCFLFCALFPKDCKLRRNDLIMYFIDEGIIQGRNREDELNKGHCILRKLEKVCLLQGGPNWKYLKMHDLVREMAIQITNENHLSLVGELTFVDMADEQKWSAGLRRVSYVGRYLLDTLSSATPPKCERMLTLLLRDCYNITSIPDLFFAHMDMLMILDLSRTGISNLPASVSNLKGLISLLLGSCSKLEKLVPLSELRALQRLDLSCTGIRELPEGIEMLTNLRDLNLYRTKFLRAIPEGVFSKLSRLECLALPKLRIGEAMAEEIASLRSLERFKAEYYYTKDLEAILKSWKKKNPEKYVLLGDEVLWRDLYDVSGVEEKYVSIKKFNDLASLCELESLKNARGLRTCYVGESDRMVCLFCRDCYLLPFFPNIEIIYLESLLNLRRLTCKCACSLSPKLRPGLQTCGSFSSLRGFRIYKCPKIEKLFVPSFLTDLGNLESLKVCDCVELQEIVQSDDDGQDHEANFEFNAFPKLKQLKLWDLPVLKRFWRSNKIVLCPLEEIDIVGCPELESLPFVGDFYDSSTLLTDLLGEIPKTNPFFSLKEVTLKKCGGIKKMFTLALPLCLENLEKLVVHDCDELVEIVQASENVDGEIVNALPKLKVLKLQSLPMLKSFCSSWTMVSDSIEQISIINCPNLLTFPLIREDLTPPASLRSITVEDEWWESIEFNYSTTKDVLIPMCDFRRRSWPKSFTNKLSNSDFDWTANL